MIYSYAIRIYKIRSFQGDFYVLEDELRYIQVPEIAYISTSCLFLSSCRRAER
jgi:hypothetical protein